MQDLHAIYIIAKYAMYFFSKANQIYMCLKRVKKKRINNIGISEMAQVRHYLSKKKTTKTTNNKQTKHIQKTTTYHLKVYLLSV